MCMNSGAGSNCLLWDGGKGGGNLYAAWGWSPGSGRGEALLQETVALILALGDTMVPVVYNVRR